jgi:Na+/melibiose symporter-like transporter
MTTTRANSNGLAIAGMICGIVGLLVFNIILGPLAVIFGGIGLRNANRGAAHRGMAMAGVVLGVIDIVLFIVVIAAASSHGFSWHAG